MALVSSSVTDVNAMVATIVKIAAGRSRPTALTIPPGEPASTARITAAIEVSSSVTPPIPSAISNGEDPGPENQLAPGVGLVEVSITDHTASIRARTPDSTQLVIAAMTESIAQPATLENMPDTA